MIYIIYILKIKYYIHDFAHEYIIMIELSSFAK